MTRLGYSTRAACPMRGIAGAPRVEELKALLDPHSLWYLLAAVMVVVGLVGTVLPALPGVPLVFGGLLLAAWAGDFQRVGVWTLAALCFLTVLALIVDFVAGLLGAQRVGASRYALIGAALGTVIGLFFGLPGLLLGPFAGALVGELAAGGSLRKAAGVGVGAWIGFVVGAVVKLGVCFAMLGIFAAAYWV